LENAVELPGSASARAVEHHVLEEMREPGDAGYFVAAPDAHPVVHGHVGDVPIGPNDHLHAVRKRHGMHLIFPRYLREGGRSDHDQANAQSAQHRHTLDGVPTIIAGTDWLVPPREGYR